MRVDPNIVYDGFNGITGGINSGLPAHVLPRTQLSRAVNCTFRGTQFTTRPGWIKRVLTFPGSNGLNDASLQTNFEDYIFQGAAAFERKKQLVVAVGGRIFRIRPDLWDVLDITPPGDSNASQNYRDYFCEAEDFMIIQDGSSPPWIYDGGSTRRSDTFGFYGKKEVPVGTVMCYSQGRLVVALTDGRSFVIGDIVGGPSGTPIYNYRDAVLKFTENDIINQGGSFAVPINAGQIKAIRPVAQVDTSTGQGPTQIFTTQAIFSLNTPSDRTAWKNLNYPIQTFSVVQAGATSDRATQPVNGDLWTRAIDGVRSFIVARRDFGSWVNTPQSRELDWIISQDEQALLLYASAARFDNRLFVTLLPYRNFQHGVPSMALGVLDFSPVAYLGAQEKPVWEGIWTGLKILQVLSCEFEGQERCFMFALDSGNNITLWEMTKDATVDDDTSTQRGVRWQFETGNYGFSTQADAPGGFDLKQLAKGYVWVSNVVSSIGLQFYYRANDDQCWHSWTSKSICATTETCDTGNCVVPLDLQSQFRRPFILPEPMGACDTTTGVPDHVGEEFQVRVTGSGYCTLSRFLVGAVSLQQDVTDNCTSDSACKTKSCCPPDYLAYSLQ